MTIPQYLFVALALALTVGGALMWLLRERIDARIERNRIRREQQLGDAGHVWSGEYQPGAGIAPSGAAGLLIMTLGLIFLSMHLLSE